MPVSCGELQDGRLERFRTPAVRLKVQSPRSSTLKQRNLNVRNARRSVCSGGYFDDSLLPLGNIWRCLLSGFLTSKIQAGDIPGYKVGYSVQCPFVCSSLGFEANQDSKQGGASTREERRARVSCLTAPIQGWSARDCSSYNWRLERWVQC